MSEDSLGSNQDYDVIFTAPQLKEVFPIHSSQISQMLKIVSYDLNMTFATSLLHVTET